MILAPRRPNAIAVLVALSILFLALGGAAPAAPGPEQVVSRADVEKVAGGKWK